MRPWMIILSSTVAAIVVAALLVAPELLHAPRVELLSILVPHLPSLAVAALGVYALGAVALTTATLVIGTLCVRHRLGRTATYRPVPERDWIASFGSTEWRRLAPRLAVAPAQPGRPDGTIVLQSRFDPDAARGELTRLHYISLARSHFFSALITLAALVGLGLAQDHGSVPFPSAAIPTTAALLILVGLVLLALLGRIAVDVAADPLIETLSRLPSEQVELGILRRAIEVLEAARDPSAATDDRGPAPMFHVPERLAVAVEEGHRALLEAIERLSAKADALEGRMHWSVEAIDTAMNKIAANAMTARAPAANEHGNASSAGFTELQAAVETLTAVLERLIALPPPADEGPRGADRALRPKPAEPRLVQDLRRLLREIEPAS